MARVICHKFLSVLLKKQMARIAAQHNELRHLMQIIINYFQLKMVKKLDGVIVEKRYFNYRH